MATNFMSTKFNFLYLEDEEPLQFPRREVRTPRLVQVKIYQPQNTKMTLVEKYIHLCIDCTLIFIIN